jgi:hypothetical protein
MLRWSEHERKYSRNWVDPSSGECHFNILVGHFYASKCHWYWTQKRLAKDEVMVLGPQKRQTPHYPWHIRKDTSLTCMWLWAPLLYMLETFLRQELLYRSNTRFPKSTVSAIDSKGNESWKDGQLPMSSSFHPVSGFLGAEWQERVVSHFNLVHVNDQQVWSQNG